MQKQHRPFEKGYLPGWTEEVFIIDRAVPGPVAPYKIKELDGEAIEGTFYEQDVQKVDVPDDAFVSRREGVAVATPRGQGALERVASKVRQLDSQE